MISPHETVFVYGTLRRGGSNYYRMEEAEFVAEAKVRGRIYQIDWFPGLVLDEMAGDVVGEVYQVSGVLLEELDAFEGAEYHRLKVDALLPDGKTVSSWAWEWLGPRDENHLIKSGDWLSPPRSAER